MSAIGYVTIGAIGGKKSGGFYDAVCAALGSERKFDKGGWLGYGVAGPGKGFMDCHTAVCPPFDGKQALAGNGIMIAYAGKSPDAEGGSCRRLEERRGGRRRLASVRRKRRTAFTPAICVTRSATRSASFARRKANALPVIPKPHLSNF